MTITATKHTIGYKELLQKQKEYFNAGKSKPIAFRVEMLEKIKRLLKQYEPALYKAVYEDFGKSEFETYATELGIVYHEIKLNIKNIKKWSKPQKVSTGLANFPAKSYIIPEPLGNVLVIGPWNYPIHLSILPAMAALAAGNTVILKTSELPAKTSAVIADLINSNFPPELFYVVEGGVEANTRLLELKFDKIFFTGSVPVGKIVYQAAAKNLVPVTLELGGKSPTFVFADCNLKTTVKRLVWAKFINAGQTCVAPDYVLVEESIQDKFISAVKAEIEKYHKNKNDIEENYLRIINDRHFDRLSKLIDNNKLCHGGITNKENRFISPTVLNNVTFDDPVMEDEIFGPVLPLIPFAHIDDAIKMVKSRPKPLSLYVYSNNRKNIRKILNEISFGGGAVNDSVMHVSNSKLPFGGVGTSGIGSYHGKAGFDCFSHHKSILDKLFWLEPPLKYPPYSKWKLSVIRWLLE